MFLAEDIVGLDIGENAVAATRVKRRGASEYEIRTAGVLECRTGMPERELAALIRSLWRTCRMPSRTVCSCLHGRTLVLRYFKYPSLSPAEFRSAAMLDAEESLQLPQSDIAADWHLNAATPASESGSPTGMEGMLVAAPARDVTAHLTLLRLAGLYPVALDARPMAVCDLFCALGGRHQPQETVCLVHLTRLSADIAIVFETRGVYARTVYSRSASWDESPEYLIENVSDVLKFYQFKLRQEPVSRLVCAGLAPARHRLLEQLSERTGMAAETWDPLDHMTIRSERVRRALKAGRDAGSAFIASLGLALRRTESE